MNAADVCLCVSVFRDDVIVVVIASVAVFVSAIFLPVAFGFFYNKHNFITIFSRYSGDHHFILSNEIKKHF